MQGFAPARPLWGNFAARPNPSTPLRTGQDGSETRGVYPELVEGLKQSSPKCRIRPGSEAAHEGGENT